MGHILARSSLLLLSLVQFSIIFTVAFDPSSAGLWTTRRTFIEISANSTNGNDSKIKLAVTYGLPIPSNYLSKGADDSIISYPVVIEYLPYRKDDSMYPIRHTYIEYFSSRGFIYAYVDIRGTGGSEGNRIEYEYSDIEIEDYTQIIQQLGDKRMFWDIDNNTRIYSNGKVGLWGQSWSACSSFILAGRKARDPRLDSLKTVIPLHCAVNLYEGDIHFLDGIFHNDEYLLSVDHENALPSYGFDGLGSVDAFKFDENYVSNRWKARPWTMFYLSHQLKDTFWTNRTAFFSGPYDEVNPDDFDIPIFAIGSLLDGYRDASVGIYEWLKAKNVTTKLAISPGTHTLMDEAVPGPLWEWKSEAAKWFYYWLVDDSDPSLISEHETALYVRLPGDDAVNVPGFWTDEPAWPPVPKESLSKYTLGNDHFLHLHEDKASVMPVNSSVHSLKYLPIVGTQMGSWWGEGGLGDMAALDAQSMTYDLKLEQDTELIGTVTVHLAVSATRLLAERGSELLAHWHVRLEDVDPESGKVAHITGASLNGAYREYSYSSANEPPSYLKSEEIYNISVPLHFTTWTFKAGHTLRIAITNSMFRMMWPSPHHMVTYIYLSSPATYVELPLRAARGPPSPDHDYSTQTPIWEYPADGWYFVEGGYPYEYSVNQRPSTDMDMDMEMDMDLDRARIDAGEEASLLTTVLWKANYITNVKGWIINVELDYFFEQSADSPDVSLFHGFARQAYGYVGTTDKALWKGGNLGFPSYYHPGPDVPPVQRAFTLQTHITVRSNISHFRAYLKRTLCDEAGNEILSPYLSEEYFPRHFQ